MSLSFCLGFFRPFVRQSSLNQTHVVQKYDKIQAVRFFSYQKGNIPKIEGRIKPSRPGKIHFRQKFKPETGPHLSLKNLKFQEVWDDDEADVLMEKMTFYDQDEGMTPAEKKHQMMNVIKKRYFKERTEGSVLTWEAKQQIRFLHNSEPDEWTVEKLAQSFPVGESGIIKILKSFRYLNNATAIAKHDERVRRRWLALKKALTEVNGTRDNIDPELQYLLDENKIPVIVNANGIPGLKMSPKTSERPKKITASHQHGLFESIIKGYRLAISAKKSEHIGTVIPKELSPLNTDNESSDEKLLQELKLLVNSVNIPGENEQLSTKSGPSTPKKTEKLSRIERKLKASQVKTPLIDLSSVQDYEFMGTEKISHQTYMPSPDNPTHLFHSGKAKQGEIISEEHKGDNKFTDESHRTEDEQLDYDFDVKKFSFQNKKKDSQNSLTERERFRNIFRFTDW